MLSWIGKRKLPVCPPPPATKDLAKRLLGSLIRDTEIVRDSNVMAALICRRHLDTIDDEKFRVGCLRLQFQPQLLLNRRVD